MEKGRRTAIPIAAGVRFGVLLVWLLAVHLAYSASHKPLDATAVEGWATTVALLSSGARLSAIGGAAAALAVSALLLFTATAVGRIIGRHLIPAGAAAAETLGLSAALGLGFFGNALLVLAALGMFNRPALAALIALALLLGAADTVRSRSRRNAPVPMTAPDRPSPDAQTPEFPPTVLPRMALIAFLTVTSITVLLRSPAPPTGWDSLVYHLTGPKLWVQAGGWITGLDLPHHYFPALMEHVYAAGLALQGEQTAPLLHAAAAAAAVVLTGALAERYVERGSGPLTAALLLSAPSLLSLAGRAYVDWTLTLFATAALWAVLRVRESPSLRGYVLLGLLLGFAAGTKYTAVGGILGAFAVLATAPGPWLPKARGIGLTFAVAALAFLPWALREWALTGHPVYPFLFGGWHWDAWRTAWFSRPGTGLITEPWRLPLVPWEVTALGAEGGLLYDGTVGPLFLTLLPLGLWSLRRRPALRPVALFAAVGYAVWLSGVATSSLLLQIRLLYPMFPALALLCAAGLLSLREWALPGLRPQRIVAAVIALDLALVAVGEVGRVGAETGLPAVVGAESRQSSLERRLGDHAAVVTQLDQSAGPDARVLFLWEPRTYLCPVWCGPDALLFNFRDALRRSESEQAIADGWRAEGYTHILLHGAGLRYFTLPPNVEMAPEHGEALTRLEACCLQRLGGPAVAEALRGEGERYTLYRLNTP
ncbi:MAG: glycosyltransferase family 39 protein [Chloroflexi bacterium]|nr:glycosyltransferase family 39 protein [Chloroflexota bacterium]